LPGAVYGRLINDGPVQAPFDTSLREKVNELLKNKAAVLDGGFGADRG